MSNSTPNIMSESQFNQEVKKWADSTRDKIRRRAPIGKDSSSDNQKLAFTQSAVRKYAGTAGKVQFTFDRHGVFVHYGVGRGYVRLGNQVVRGRKLNQLEKTEKIKRGYSRKSVTKMKVANTPGAIQRTPVDWFDVEIKTGLKQLADIAQEYYGDKTLESVLKQMDKALIEKK